MTVKEYQARLDRALKHLTKQPLTARALSRRMRCTPWAAACAIKELQRRGHVFRVEQTREGLRGPSSARFEVVPPAPPTTEALVNAVA